jgi:hypothetical protein
MKRSLVLTLCCLIMAVAAPAFATLVPCISTVYTGNISIDADWDEGYGTFGGVLCDKVDIYLTGISGVEAGHLVQAISGSWTSTQQFYVWNKAATVTAFKTHTTISPALGGLYYGAYSCVNFSGVAGTWARQAGTDATYWSNLIKGTWSDATDVTENWTPAAIGAADDNDGDNQPENLICSMLIKSAAAPQSITFGDGTSASQFGYDDGPVVNTYFKVEKTVPEPSTLALVGCGLFGLLAYAWRKRK